jgi:hypothetical protein
MTEVEWQSGTDPMALVRHVLDAATARKLRLFFLAVCRDLSWSDAPPAYAVHLAARLADGRADPKNVRAAQARLLREGGPGWGRGWLLLHHDMPSQFRAWWDEEPFFDPRTAPEACRILRDVLGNPFRPAARDRRYRTPDVLGLARAAYDEGAFDRLPLLADALMDAGCVDESILGHLRGSGPHVPGCWVVDLVLGQE